MRNSDRVATSMRCSAGSKGSTRNQTTLAPFLEIGDLRDVWNDQAIARVWRSVLLLQPPFPISTRVADTADRRQDPGFAVIINGASREDKKTEYSIERSFLSQAIATVTASIDDAGVATVRVISPKLDVDDTQAFAERYLVTGSVKFSTHYFIYASDTLSGMSQNVAAEMGRTFGGLRVYRNGFRVLPYGQALDDWLQLDMDVSRRELLVPGNNRNFFGHVELTTEENPLFEETSSREGLLENEAFQELRRFVRNAVEWAIKRIASARKRKQDAGQRGFVAQPRRPSEFLRDLIDDLGSAPQGHELPQRSWPQRRLWRPNMRKRSRRSALRRSSTKRCSASWLRSACPSVYSAMK